jgi:SAM-dependent methyltransferase
MAVSHFYEQRKHAQDYIIPYFDRYIPGWRTSRVLEMGCAEAGLMDALMRAGVCISGIEVEAGRVARALVFNPRLDVRLGDITDPDVQKQFKKSFHLIILRDVIEHIEDRDAVFRNIRSLLQDKGAVYITFPPRFSPFGGHHQNGRSILRRMPYLQILPSWKIRFLGRIFREQPHIIENAILNFKIGLSIRHFKRLMRKYGFSPVICEYFLMRPVYASRFGWPVIRFPNIPVFREFMVLGVEGLFRIR